MVAEHIPDLALTASDGGLIRLADFVGRPLVLYFYPKDDTPGCTREAQDFSTHLADFAAAGVAVLGVSKDSPARHVKFAAKYGLGVALATDESGAVMEALGVWVEKSLYGRRYMGIERATFLFDASGKLAQAWRKVKVADHAAQVLAAARAIAG